jgi:hypothetical protein
MVKNLHASLSEGNKGSGPGDQITIRKSHPGSHQAIKALTAIRFVKSRIFLSSGRRAKSPEKHSPNENFFSEWQGAV